MMPIELPVSTLRFDLFVLAAASFIASLGVAALALYALRRRSADLTPLAFAAFALMYAVRLAITTPTMQAAGGSGVPWSVIGAGLTYAILPAGAWMGESLLGAGWRGSIRLVRIIAMAVAPVAIAGIFVTAQPEWLMLPNNLLVVAMMAAIGATVVRRGADIATIAVRAGTGVAVAFVVAENLRGMAILPWPARLEFLGIVAFACSIAFAVADRFLRTEGRLAGVERELATARRIQQAILPERVPELQRFRFGVKYLPMTEVAGDFYDFLDVSGPRGTVLVADVSGHGVPAALIASMVKVAAASHAGSAADPGVLLSAMSRTLEGQLGGQFLTAMCLRLDAERGEIAWAGAGHPPLLHWHAADRTLDTLNSDGILMGVAQSQYASRAARVRSGDRLLVYTDGVLEAANEDGAFFGDERFHAVIADNAAKSGPELARAIVDDMIRWSGRESGFEDDVTLVVVEVN